MSAVPIFLNLTLRSLALGGRFLLFIVLAKAASPEDVGFYGIFYATVGICGYLLGLEFHTISNRELMRQNRKDVSIALGRQAGFFSISYLAALPLLLLLYPLGVLPWNLALWFYLLLVLEHLGQEAYRLLLALSRPLMANTTLFLRTASWVPPLAYAAWVERRTIGLEEVFQLWSIAGGATLILAAFILRTHARSTIDVKIFDLRQFKHDVRRSGPFFIGSFSLICAQFADRYAVRAFEEVAVLGAYVFFAGLAGALYTLVNASVTATHLPRVVSAFHGGTDEAREAAIRSMWRGTLGVGLVGMLVAAIAISPVLALLDDPLYENHLTLFWILLVANLIRASAEVPTTRLYAKGRDRAILLGNFSALITALCLNVVAVPLAGAIGAALATLGAYVVLFVVLWRCSARDPSRITT